MTKKIRDNPKYKQGLLITKGLSYFGKALGFLESIGLRTPNEHLSAKKMQELYSQMKALASFPDEFNQRFADLGWIAHESMNHEVAEKGIGLFDKGEVEQAENVLVEGYDRGRIEFLIWRLQRVPAFRARRSLADQYLDDYEAGRYHACVPGVLMLLDGLVNDVRQTGFFADGTDLEVWDSIAGHSSGLTKLRGILSASRKKTTTDPLRLPYRNGILHGRDLSFGNKLVAAKCWAALAAVGDWADGVRTESARKEEFEKQEQESQKGFFAAMKEYTSNHSKSRARMQTLDRYQPRHIEIGNPCPATGDPDCYEKNTPERALAEFFEYWKTKNYGKMVSVTYFMNEETAGKRAGQLRERFSDLTILGFEFVRIKHVAAAAAEIEVKVQARSGSREGAWVVQLRLLHLDEQGDSSIYGVEPGSWLIHELFLGKMEVIPWTSLQQKSGSDGAP